PGRGDRGAGAARALQRYVVRRVAALAVTLFFVSLLIFVVVRVLPGDPALIILGLEASPETVARVRHALGLDQPIPVQYARWVGQALRGDLGRSIQYDLPVGTLILSRLAVTLPLTLLAAGFMIVAAIPLGVFAATRHRRWGDYLTMTLSQLGVAVPGFWAGCSRAASTAGAPGSGRVCGRCCCPRSRSGSSSSRCWPAPPARPCWRCCARSTSRRRGPRAWPSAPSCSVTPCATP